MEWEILEISSRIYSMPRMGTIRDRTSKDLKGAEDIKKKWQEKTQKNYTKKLVMTRIIMMVWSLRSVQSSSVT